MTLRKLVRVGLALSILATILAGTAAIAAAAYADGMIYACYTTWTLGLVLFFTAAMWAVDELGRAT